MELINETSLGARLWATTLTNEARMLAVVVVKGTYFCTSGAADPDSPYVISNTEQQTEFGNIPGDLVPWKSDVDVYVLGKAHAPLRRPVESLTCTAKVGPLERSFMVTGERVWQRNEGGLMPSRPEPFVELPLTWERAFGGVARLSAGSGVPHAYNASGKGFILEEPCAEGVQLANVEDPAAPVRVWSDAPLPSVPVPLPVGSQFYADDMLAYPKSSKELGVDDVTWKGLSFNAAHPLMRHPDIQPGDAVRLQGWQASGDLAFRLPTSSYEVEVQLDTRRYCFPAKLDTVCVLPEENRFFVIYRRHFTYSVRPGETRLARLRLSRR